MASTIARAGVVFCFVVQVFLLLIWSPVPVRALIPTICADNVTTSKICCPTPPGFHLPCGGPSRGYCRKYQVPQDFPNLETVFSVDDRLNWPKRFFHYGCHCEPNFFGTDCSECWFGMSGGECKEKIYYKRRNIFSFSRLEKLRFVKMMARTRSVNSGYVVLLEKEVGTSDPLSRLPRFISASLHYYLVYIHRYASRRTLFNDPKLCKKYGFLDYNHGGPGFLTWHRMFILVWERALRKMAIEMYGWKDFAIPYWDWVDAKWCEVCTNDLMGTLGRHTKEGRRIHEMSPFYQWDEYCTEPMQNTGEKQCFGCHFSRFGKLVRGFNSLRYPTSEDVDYVLNLKVYFEPLRPNQKHSEHCNAFQEAMEGFCGRKGAGSRYTFMHNKVHNMVEGSFCCSSTAVNDPMFAMHHSQVDRLMQAWFVLRRPHETQMATQRSLPGHTKDDNMVGFFPPVPHRMMFVDMTQLGIVFDSHKFGWRNRKMFSHKMPHPPPEWVAFMAEMARKEAAKFHHKK